LLGSTACLLLASYLPRLLGQSAGRQHGACLICYMENMLHFFLGCLHRLAVETRGYIPKYNEYPCYITNITGCLVNITAISQIFQDIPCYILLYFLRNITQNIINNCRHCYSPCRGMYFELRARSVSRAHARPQPPAGSRRYGGGAEGGIISYQVNALRLLTKARSR
jgi:hypothetical protein